MSEKDLVAQADKNDFPKWASLCLLRWLDAGTLAAALVTPSHAATSPGAAEVALTNLASHLGKNRLMIRTDTARENTTYVRGGNTFDLSRAITFAEKVLADGRAVIALEPTNRFTNRATVNIGVEQSGVWRCEILGPGYDASDLQRNGTPPEYVCNGLPFDACAFVPLRELSCCIAPQNAISMEARIAARIDNIVSHIFPGMGIVPAEPVEVFCRNWLAQRGDTALFRKNIIPFPFRAFRYAFETAQLLHHYRLSQKKRGSFVLSSGILEDGRQIFWDIADSEKKWTN